MLTGGLLRLLNHALAGEDRARERLRSFAGQSVELLCGSWHGYFRIADDGYLLADVPGEAPPTVHIRLPADTPWRLLGDRESLLTETHLTGNAQFAETLAFVFRHLRWDAEADLAAIFGDILGRRLHQAGQAFIGTNREIGRRLSANLSEYLSQEANVLVSRPVFDDFRARLNRLNSDLQTLESRLFR